MVAKERRLKTLKAWIKDKIRRKIFLTPNKKPQILLLLSSAQLLTKLSPKQQFKIGDVSYFICFPLFRLPFFFFFLKNVSYFLYDQ